MMNEKHFFYFGRFYLLHQECESHMMSEEIYNSAIEDEWRSSLGMKITFLEGLRLQQCESYMMSEEISNID